MKRFLCLCVSTRHAEASSSYCCCCCCWNVWKIEAKSKGQKRTDRNKKRGKLVVRVDLYIPHSYNTQIKKKAKREAKICEKKQSRSKGDVDVVSLFGLYLFSLFFLSHLYSVFSSFFLSLSVSAPFAETLADERRVLQRGWITAKRFNKKYSH